MSTARAEGGLIPFHLIAAPANERHQRPTRQLLNKILSHSIEPRLKKEYGKRKGEIDKARETMHDIGALYAMSSQARYLRAEGDLSTAIDIDVLKKGNKTYYVAILRWDAEKVKIPSASKDVFFWKSKAARISYNILDKSIEVTYLKKENPDDEKSKMIWEESKSPISSLSNEHEETIERSFAKAVELANGKTFDKRNGENRNKLKGNPGIAENID